MLKPLGHKPHYAKIEAARATEVKSSCRGTVVAATRWKYRKG